MGADAAGGGINLGGNRSAVGPGGPIVSRASAAVQSQAGSPKSGGNTTVVNVHAGAFQSLGFADENTMIMALRTKLVRSEQQGKV